MITDRLKEVIPDIVSLINMNGIIIVDEIASELEKSPQFANTSISEKFKNIAYSTLQLPGAVASDVVADGVGNLGEAVDEFEAGVKETIAEEDASDKKDGKTEGDVPPTSENVGSADGNDDGHGVTDPKKENIANGDTSGTDNQNETANVETQIEANTVKNDWTIKTKFI